MELHTLGIGFQHDSSFLIERPNGSGDELLLIFKSPAIIRLEDNIHHIPSGSAIVYSGKHPQYYGADGQVYINHWVHFDAGGDAAFFERIGLPFNTILHISDIAAAEEILVLLNKEIVSGGTNSTECTELLLRLLLARLGGKPSGKEISLHSAALRELRAEIYRDPAKCRSIAELAALQHLSQSHFQYLYKREFGISCYDDILRARLDRAKYYLKNTTLSVIKIAELCGYENDVHFIRQFKKRTGCTATQYRSDSLQKGAT